MIRNDSKNLNRISFIKETDSLSEHINQQANVLYKKLITFDVAVLQTDAFFKEYFSNHHLGKRLIFSIQNSAHILYHSIKRINKPIDSLNVVDYGAGLGTLFMLGSMIGVKRFLYNDHLAEWKNNAELICNALQIPVNGYIVGDISDVINYAEQHDFALDIITSRNVIEHIYNLRDFYTTIYHHNSKAVIYSTTTANYQNPVTKLQHILIHRKTEKKYYEDLRRKEIVKINDTLSGHQLNELIELTRGRAGEDFVLAVKNYLTNTPIAPVEYLNSNTVDCTNGVWAEHLLSKAAYTDIISKAGFKIEYSGGFWDTHYKYAIVNMFTGVLNVFIKMLGKKGYIISPFINVVAYN